MDAGGTLLAISAVDPKCDGRSRFDYSIYDDLCGTGSVQLHQYKPTNPPWRSFSLTPQILDTNLLKIMDTQRQVTDKIILGLQVSLSGDGSVLSVSGYDIDGDYGFV
eukprot:58270_1